MNARRGIWAALAVTLAAVAWTSAIEGDDEAVAVRPARNAGASVAAKSADAERRAAPPAKAQRASAEEPRAWPTPPADAQRPSWAALDRQAARAWSPPPLPPPAPSVSREAAAAANEPVMPPVPYTLLGRLDDGAQPMALIAGAQRTYSAKAGDVLDGAWRVESVGPQGVALVWLPGMRSLQLTYRPSS